jgi:hypothetical protein
MFRNIKLSTLYSLIKSVLPHKPNAITILIILIMGNDFDL